MVALINFTACARLFVIHPDPGELPVQLPSALSRLLALDVFLTAAVSFLPEVLSAMAHGLAPVASISAALRLARPRAHPVRSAHSSPCHPFVSDRVRRQLPVPAVVLSRHGSCSALFYFLDQCIGEPDRVPEFFPDVQVISLKSSFPVCLCPSASNSEKASSFLI
jgi:hypothetical protein